MRFRNLILALLQVVIALSVFACKKRIDRSEEAVLRDVDDNRAAIHRLLGPNQPFGWDTTLTRNLNQVATWNTERVRELRSVLETSWDAEKYALIERQAPQPGSDLNPANGRRFVFYATVEFLANADAVAECVPCGCEPCKFTWELDAAYAPDVVKTFLILGDHGFFANQNASLFEGTAPYWGFRQYDDPILVPGVSSRRRGMANVGSLDCTDVTPLTATPPSPNPLISGSSLGRRTYLDVVREYRCAPQRGDLMSFVSNSNQRNDQRTLNFREFLPSRMVLNPFHRLDLQPLWRRGFSRPIVYGWLINGMDEPYRNLEQALRTPGVTVQVSRFSWTWESRPLSDLPR